MVRSKGILAIALSMPLVVVLGCGPQYDVVPVTGKVTYEGQPVGDLIVKFSPTEGRTSEAFTAADGTFEMGYTLDEKGVEIGGHKVTVMWSPSSEDAEAPPELVQKVLDDFEANGPIEVTIESAQTDFEIALPR